MAPRTSYAWAFTIEAVTLVTERGLPRQQVARDLGLDIGMRRRWVTEFTTDSGRAFPAHVHARDEQCPAPVPERTPPPSM